MEDSAKNTAHNKRSNGSGISIGGVVDTSKAERAMWLMKCPAIVSRSLQSPSPDDPSRPVAKVIISIDLLPSKENSKETSKENSKETSKEDDSPPQFTMELAGTEPGNGVRSYSMDMSTDFVPMSVFSESSQGKFSVEGKILNKFDMRPHSTNLENYGKICRERTNKSMAKGRQIKVIDNDRGNHMRPMPLMIESTEKKKPPAKASETKRTRRDRGEMEGIMFKLFERQSNWTLRQLIQETDQPEQFVKDILKDLCVYNNKGSNQGSYELKPEYKKSEEGPAP